MATKQSNLLLALEQLGDAAWTNTLLPLLRADESAGAVALTCQQLRRLVHGNQRELKLTAATCAHLLDGQAPADVFRRHFAACNDVTLTISSVADAAGAGLLLSMLARLPSLSSLHLNIQDKEASAACHVMPLVQLLQLQLTGPLRSLQLTQHGQACVGSAPFWAKVGAIAGLSKLVLSPSPGPWDPEESRVSGLSMHQLSLLAPLGSSLKHLQLPCIEAHPEATQDWSCLSALTSLTHLELPITYHRANWASIRACSSLQNLGLSAHARSEDEGPELDDGEWAALAQLTALTSLQLSNVVCPLPDVLGPCLASLSGLQELELNAMKDHHLRALASLTRLTSLSGLWGSHAEAFQPVPAGTDPAPAFCRSVRSACLLGACPLAALPSVESLLVGGTWAPARLASLSRHCRQLRDLNMRQVPMGSLDSSASAAERVAAIRSLTGLQHLTSLQFIPNDDAEVAAISCLSHIRELVLECDCSSISAQGLGLLGLMAGHRLEQLTLHICATDDDYFGLASAETLVMALRGVPSVTIREETGATGVFRDAVAAARELALPLPASCNV